MDQKLQCTITPAAGRNLEHAGLIRTFKPRSALRDVFGELLDRDAGVDPAHAGLAR